MTGFPIEPLIFLAVVGITLYFIVRDYKRGPKGYATVKELLHLETKLERIWAERFELFRLEMHAKLKEK